MLIGTVPGSLDALTVPDVTREQGFYILGRRGMGKSTLLESLIAQDIYNNAGVAVFDPHGSLIDAILNRVPEMRVKDVVYLDASDPEYAFGINLFDRRDLNDEIELSRAVDGVVQTFKKVWGVGDDASWGPLLQDLLSNITHTLMENGGQTLAEIPALLYKPEFRRRMVSSVQNLTVRDFWEFEWDPLTNRQQIMDRRSTTNKVRAFLRDPVLLHVLGQSTSTIDFRQIMDESKILLVKLPDGPRVSETAVALLGSLMIGQLLRAVMGRPAVSETPMFYLYADEFQRFATPAFATLINETRKYRVSTTIAHQQRSQLDDAYRDAALGSTNFAVFQVTGEDAAELVTQFNVTTPEADPDPNQWEQVQRGLHPNPEMANLIAGLQDAIRWIRSEAEWMSGVRFDRKEYSQNQITYYNEDIDHHGVNRLMDWLDDRISLFFSRARASSSIDQATQHRDQLLDDLEAEMLKLWQVDRQEPPPWDEVRERLHSKRAAIFWIQRDRLGPAVAKIHLKMMDEPIRTGPRRTVSDARAEFANQLATLAPRMVAVRFWDGQRYQQGVVRMPRILPAVDNPEKAERIKAESRERYYRKRSEIDAEIRERRRALEVEPNEPEPILDELPPPPTLRRRKISE